ncbi:MAG TPA: non-heme iron oxygenase ferredoxin subunit [Azospirillum sp.]|nr:non-heme iron oxygenase ferredoxin subunit [Azospirillum sp.]
MLYLCEVSDVAEGAAKRIDLPERPPLAVFHLPTGLFVTDDTCTHGLASLSEGEIDDGVVECPWHQGAFDIATGKPCGAPCTIPLRTHRVVVSDGKVFLEE